MSNFIDQELEIDVNITFGESEYTFGDFYLSFGGLLSDGILDEEGVTSSFTDEQLPARSFTDVQLPD